MKIQVFGHSFVRRLKSYIKSSSDASFHFNLEGHPLVQYSGYPGAIVDRLMTKLEHISDFAPDIVLLVVGSNDIYDCFVDPEDVAAKIMNLASSIHIQCRVQIVIVAQITHRCPPSVTIRYRVDTSIYNGRVDTLNRSLHRLSGLHSWCRFWRLKGFWAPGVKASVFAPDGCHLSDAGNRKLYTNFRAAIITTIRSL